MIKALVIGANGFLGRNICESGLRQGWDVYGLYHNTNDKIPTKVKQLSLAELERNIINYDFIFHAAGSFLMPINNLIEININLTEKITKLFQDSHIIFISSTAVYGNHTKVIEDTSVFDKPNSYGLSKLAGEFVLSAHKNSTILRLTALYGSGMNKNLFIYKIIESAAQNNQVTIIGDGERKQDYLYIKDAADLCVLAAKKKKQGIYIGATGMSISNNKVVEILKACRPEVEIQHQGTDTSPSYAFNISRTVDEMNFKPKYSFEEGLKEMLEQYE